MTPPIACTLDRAAIERQRGQLLPGLVPLATARIPLPDGLRLSFAPTAEALAAIIRTVDAERRCCLFFRFQLTFEPGLGPLTLDITGPPGTGAFLEQLPG